MKIIHTKDGRTLYKSDDGRWLKKGEVEAMRSSDVREPSKEEQIAMNKEIADRLNGTQEKRGIQKTWTPGTGPDSATFKSALAYAKRRINRGYSWGELVADASIEHYLSREDEELLEDKLRMHAMRTGDYSELHEDWKKDFEQRGIKIKQRSSKIDMEVKKLTKEEKQAEFNAKCKEIQQQYVGMDVDTFAKDLTSKNINEKLGIEATENQRWELVRLFKSIAEHQRAYDENKTPKIFEKFEIIQDQLYDHSEYTSKKYIKMIGIYLRLKGNTGHEYIDFLDSKTTHVWMGPKGGLTTYVDGREVRVSTLDATFGSDWIESQYGKKRGKKS